MVRARSIAMWLCMAAAAGCGDDGDDGGDGVDAPAPRTRMVTGRMFEHHVTAPGVDESFPIDLSNATISAFIPDTMVTLPASGANGTFLIANVPEGEYYLRVGTRYLARTTDTVDLDYYEIGRTDALPATLPTTVRFDVGDLAPWQIDDELELYSVTARTAAYVMQADASEGVPAVGATSLADFAYDLMRAFSPGRPSAPQGDQVTMTQLATQQVGGHTFKAVARAFTPTPFTVLNGADTMVAGAFTTPASVPLALTWDRPAFDSEIRAHSPGDEADTFSYMLVVALPDAHLHGYYGPAPDLVVYVPGYSLDHTTLTTTGWTYADPFPPTWTRFAFLEYFTYQFIGNIPKFGSISQSVDLASVGTTPIRPTIGLPVDVMINGRDAFTAQTGVGLTPTISWSPPTFGTPDKYLVRVLEVPAAGELINLELLETTRTSITIPPGIMLSGNSYAFTVVARAATTLDAEATPFRDPTLPSCFTRVTTAFVSP